MNVVVVWYVEWYVIGMVGVFLWYVVSGMICGMLMGYGVYLGGMGVVYWVVCGGICGM